MQQPQRNSDTARVLLACLAVLILTTVYLFHDVGFYQTGARLLAVEQHPHPYTIFIINKTIRLLINDLACLLLIFSIFQQRKYLTVAFYVFLFELLVLLPFYFVVKLSVEGDSEISSPLLSQVHRMIINPTMMIILIMGFFYQRMRSKG